MCVAQLDRALGYGPRCRGFESSRARRKMLLHWRFKIVDVTAFFIFMIKESSQSVLSVFCEINFLVKSVLDLSQKTKISKKKKMSKNERLIIGMYRVRVYSTNYRKQKYT